MSNVSATLSPNSDNGNPYVSSIVSVYGDVDRVKQDVTTLNDILSRQGSRLLLDVIAESIGRAALTYKLTPLEVTRLRNSTIDSLNMAIIERT